MNKQNNNYSIHNIIQINEEYYNNKNIKHISKKFKIDENTIKKILIKNYVGEKDLIKQYYDETTKIINNDTLSQKHNNLNDFLFLSNREKKEIEEIWKEIQI